MKKKKRGGKEKVSALLLEDLKDSYCSYGKGPEGDDTNGETSGKLFI